MAPKKSSIEKNKIGKKKMKHNVEVVEAAVEVVRSKAWSLRKVAKHFGIALSTLKDKVKGRSPIEIAPRTLLTTYEETRLVEWVLRMSRLAFGQTTDDIRWKAKSILELRGGSTKDPSNLPSVAWTYNLLKRHPELTLRTPMPLGKDRALVTRTNIKKWFSGLEEYLNEMDPSLLCDPTRIFNADESGFSFDPKSRKVVAFKGAKTVYALSLSTRTQVTVLAALSAAGMYLPPLMIYPYKRIPGKNLLEGFPDALLQVSDNGWITSAIFYSWLRDSFIPATKDLKKPVLLLVDGHVSHKSMIETSQICEDHGILLYCLLAHSSHLIQPLDQAFFGSIKSAWSTATRRHMADTGETVGLDTFARVFQPVWKSSATASNAASSFRAAGIFPFSPERVLSSEKLNLAQLFRDDVPFNADAAHIPAQSQPSSSSNPDDNPLPSQHKASSEVDEVDQDQSILSASLPQSPPHIPAPTSNDDDALFLLDNAGDAYPLEINKSLSCQPPSPPHIPAQSQPSTSSNPDHNSLPSQHKASSAVDHGQSILFDSQPPSPPLIPAQSQPSTSSNPSDNPLPSYTAKQIEAMKTFALCVIDDLGRNEFLKCLQNIARDTGDATEDKFTKFLNAAATLKEAFKVEPEISTGSRAPLTLDDILRVPNFSAKGKPKRFQHRKPAPTMQYVLSGAEHREAITRKEEERERGEKEKLSRKTKREEKARKRKENLETMRLRREIVKAERKEKAAEAQRKKQERIDIAQLKELEKEAQKERTTSESGEDENENVEKEMEESMRIADDEEMDVEEMFRSDECRGCRVKGENELLVACDTCDSWWHTRCTKVAANFSEVELENFPFVCDECCPNQ